MMRSFITDILFLLSLQGGLLKKSYSTINIKATGKEQLIRVRVAATLCT